MVAGLAACVGARSANACSAFWLLDMQYRLSLSSLGSLGTSAVLCFFFFPILLLKE